MWWAVNPNRGGAVTWLAVPYPAGDTLYATRDGDKSQGGGHNQSTVQSGTGGTYSARCRLTWQLWIPGKHGFHWSGLTGLICVPQGYGHTYQTFLQEAEEEAVDFFSTTKFQSYWQHASEDIQSSELGCHFGHYKAASDDQYHLAMHAAKLTLAASTSVPLACWWNGLMIAYSRVLGTST